MCWFTSNNRVNLVERESLLFLARLQTWRSFRRVFASPTRNRNSVKVGVAAHGRRKFFFQGVGGSNGKILFEQPETKTKTIFC